jgi:hypothetical protein
MTNSAPTRFKTSDLDKFFNISKATRVKRLTLLGLTSDCLTKEGKFYFLSDTQVQLFTAFDRHITETGNPDGFPGLCSDRSNRADDLDALVDAEEIGLENAPAQIEEPQAGQLAKTREIKPLQNRPDSTFSSGEFTEDRTENLAGDRALVQHITRNAQRKATAMLLAEQALADQYMQNPHLLDPELRAQVDGFEFSTIDPKELAASLVASAQLMKAA